MSENGAWHQFAQPLAPLPAVYTLPLRGVGVMTRTERRIALGGLLVAAASLLIAGLEYLSSPERGAPVQVAPIPVTVSVQNPAPPPEDKLAKLVNERTIGRQLQYFEATAGVPLEVYGSERHYEVDRCRLVIKVDNSSAIESLSMEVSPRCTFEWRDLMHNAGKLGPPERTTLATLRDQIGGWTLLSGCLSGCGNAADPELLFYREGSHADGWINMLVGITLDGTHEIERSNVLEARVTQNLGSDASLELNAVCDPRLEDWAFSAMADVTVERVTIGTNLIPVEGFKKCSATTG
jgi:hypothetical protein